MRPVIRLASENVATGRGGPFAALIVKEGRVIAEAVNTVFTANDPTAHAEVNAIRKAFAAIGDFALRGFEIYTSSEPCPMCLAAIYFGNTCEDAAHAGFDDTHIFRQLTRNRANRAIRSEQVLRDEALESFRIWELSPNKRE